MKKNFVKKLALGLALVMTASSVSVPVSAAAAPAFKDSKAVIETGDSAVYKIKSTADWKFKKVVSKDTAVATAEATKIKAKTVKVKITGVKAGETVVKAVFKNKETKEKSQASLPVTVEDNTVTKAANDYFANYVDRKKQPADVFKLMDENANIVIIDIRGAEDYAKEHLKGAINIPYAQIAEHLDIIPDDVPVYVNCYSGQTASQTIALLSVAGKDAYNIQGGWNNGISKAENYANYVDAVAVPLPTKEYPVDADIQKAITDYYKEATSNTYASFNFPVAKLAELVEAGSDEYTIVDIRSAEDYAKGHIKGAKINIPFPGDMPAGFAKIPTDKPVIVQCYSGQTASQTVAILRLLGYEAYNLSGGMGAEGGSGWLGGGNSVVTE